MYYNVIFYYTSNIMGPPSYMECVVDRNLVMRRIPLLLLCALKQLLVEKALVLGFVERASPNMHVMKLN
jgi:hypothetical protein